MGSRRWVLAAAGQKGGQDLSPGHKGESLGVCAVKLLGRGFSDLEVQFASNVSIQAPQYSDSGTFFANWLLIRVLQWLAVYRNVL
jgi:hypothetical protein